VYISNRMRGWEAASTMRGVRMHCEQSRVGKVSESWDMCPPSEDERSTRTTSAPPSARSRAVWMPAMPPPITRARRVTGTRIGSKGRSRDTLLTVARTSEMAFFVACSRSEWTHEHCSRRLVISQRYGFRPAVWQVLRKVVSCMRGEQAATTTPVSLCWRMASRILA